MKTFEEFQALATKVPLSLRNNRDRINLPILRLQEEAGKIGSLLAKAAAFEKLSLTQAQKSAVRDRLADVLWCVALFCGETGIAMPDLATHSLAQLQLRAKSGSAIKGAGLRAPQF